MNSIGRIKNDFLANTAQKMKFYTKDIFSKCDQYHRFGHIY